MASDSNSRVRVRFAPSPTGHLHVGGARTALYNWLFARSQGGSFVLRIEDTDVSRSTEENIEKIKDSLEWLGLDWDEGPETGGEFGPYRQMERLELYRREAEKLTEEKKAYRCYCTPGELDKARQQAKARGRPLNYNGHCRDLTNEEEQKLKESGRVAAIRLRTPDTGATVVKDIIRGIVRFDNVDLGDFIIIRSTGVPTYNFAAVVDDAAMKISHVIRGDDHLPNTPKQLMVFDAMGKEAPAYAHLPLILGTDRAPLSKRHGSVSIEEFRSQGYVREAVCNYLALLGWSYDAKTTLFTVEELIDKFSLERVGSAGAVFDIEKLTWMNGHYIRAMSGEGLAGRLTEYLGGTRLAGLPGVSGRPGVNELVPLVQEKIKTLADFVSLTDFLFLPVEYDPESLNGMRQDEASLEILKHTVRVIESIDSFEVEEIDRALRAAAEKMDLKLGKFLKPVRIAVSGRTVTPGMFETLAVLGRKESISRIKSTIKLLESTKTGTGPN